MNTASEQLACTWLEWMGPAAALQVLFPAGQVGNVGEVAQLMTIMPKGYPGELPAVVANYLIGQGWVRPARSSGRVDGTGQITHVRLTHRGHALLENTKMQHGPGA